MVVFIYDLTHGVNTIQIRMPDSSPQKTVRCTNGDQLRHGEWHHGRALEVRGRVVEDDPQEPHQTMPYKLQADKPFAHRWTKIADRAQGWEKLSPKDHMYLAALGAPTPGGPKSRTETLAVVALRSTRFFWLGKAAKARLVGIPWELKKPVMQLSIQITWKFIEGGGVIGLRGDDS